MKVDLPRKTLWKEESLRRFIKGEKDNKFTKQLHEYVRSLYSSSKRYFHFLQPNGIFLVEAQVSLYGPINS